MWWDLGFFAFVMLFLSGFILLSFAIMRLSFYGIFFQQEEYDAKRFFKLIFTRFKLIDKILTGFLLLCYVLQETLASDTLIPYLLLHLAFLVIMLRDYIAFTNSKKKLVFTARVKRILLASLSLFVLLLIIMLCNDINVQHVILYYIVLVQALPFVLVLGNALLKPYEFMVQRHYYKQAVTKLADLSPEIIGITGSYGKTSVKHILSHILNQAVPTYATPGSVNTVMGITRIIREKLQKTHRFFLSEMGAYGIGSITRICNFTPPDHGILTAVGCAHYERFKSVEAVAQAKFELLTAVQKKQGFFVVNKDQVDQAFIDTYAGSYEGLITVSTKSTKADFMVENYTQTSEGLALTVKFGNETVSLETPLFGEHHVSNIAQVFALSVKLGVPVSTIVAAFKTVPQIKHRLEVKRQSGEPILIDDAYNANPEGFASALETLSLLKNDTNGRGILVTPGMVELGTLHDEKHLELGVQSGKQADIVLVVKAKRIPTFIEGLKKTNAQIELFDSFAQAHAWLKEHAKKEDVILYENDLPDLYESKAYL